MKLYQKSLKCNHCKYFFGVNMTTNKYLINENINLNYEGTEKSTVSGISRNFLPLILLFELE